MKRVLVSVVTILAVFIVFILVFGPLLVDRIANPVLEDPPYAVDPNVQRFYDELFVVDLHADSLLWDRDLKTHLSHGAVDVPRLVEGNVAIQCFFIVSKTPFTGNIDRTVDGPDAITPLVFAQGWPWKTWGSLLERALYQSAVLRGLAGRSDGALTILETKDDLRLYREARKAGGPVVAGVLGLEGAHALEDDLRNLDKLHAAGVRIIAPTHFFDNAFGGSAHGTDKSGLTELGRQLIAKMEARGILLDLAHASSALIEDAVKIATKPVVASHTGARGHCDNNRNLTDAALKAIAETGGVIGIGYWEQAVCGKDAKAIADAIRYTSDLVGVDHVALGSDFDGGVPVPFDTTGLVLIAEALLEAGFTKPEVRKIMGGNAVRVFEQTLPD